MKMYQLS